MPLKYYFRANAVNPPAQAFPISWYISHIDDSNRTSLMLYSESFPLQTPWVTVSTIRTLWTKLIVTARILQIVAARRHVSPHANYIRNTTTIFPILALTTVILMPDFQPSALGNPLLGTQPQPMSLLYIRTACLQADSAPPWASPERRRFGY